MLGMYNSVPYRKRVHIALPLRISSETADLPHKSHDMAIFNAGF